MINTIFRRVVIWRRERNEKRTSEGLNYINNTLFLKLAGICSIAIEALEDYS